MTACGDGKVPHERSKAVLIQGPHMGVGRGEHMPGVGTSQGTAHLASIHTGSVLENSETIRR